jgi:hypothetical protein
MKEKPSGCGLASSWATMTLIVGFFLLPLGFILGFLIFGVPAAFVLGGIALVLAAAAGLLLALYYRRLESGG